MNNQQIQQRDSAGHTKLTAVTISRAGRRATVFVPLLHNDRGQAILPVPTLDRMLDDIGCRVRGQTFTVG
jgi:hypothetical protein